MSNLFWLSEERFEKIKPLLPNDVRGVPRVDDRRVLSGIIHVIKRGLHWSDCPAEYGPAKTIYNRYARWGEKGVSARIFVALVTVIARGLYTFDHTSNTPTAISQGLLLKTERAALFCTYPFLET